jgi:two-component system sensor histidine kinase YesM
MIRRNCPLARKTSILSQLIIGFSIILVLILTVTSYFSLRYSSRVVVDKTSQYLMESVVQMRGKTDVMLLEYDRLSQRIAFSPEVQQHFLAVKQGRVPATSKAEIIRYGSEQGRYPGSDLTLHMLDSDGVIYSRNDALAFYWQTQDQLEQTAWYPSVREMKGKMLWLSGTAWSNGATQAIIGARQLNDWTSLERLGDLFVLFSVDTLQRVIEENGQDSSRTIHVVDSRGVIVYAANPEEIGQTLNPLLFEEMEGEESGLINWNVNDRAHYVAYSKSSYSGWTIAAYIQAADAVEDLQQIQNSTLLIGLFAICAALLLTTFFAWSVARPIRYLAHRLSRVERGILNPYKGKMINREVSTLFDSFNDMVGHLDETIQDLSSKQATEKQAQINALKAQFRPHFLYNSLNTIYWQLVNEGNDKAAEMVLTLSDLMRYSIQPGSELVTIQEDLNQLHRYILLQTARYGAKLQVQFDVDESLLAHKIMKMLLQPLVENAITHGLEQVKGRPWIIRIAIKRDGEQIWLLVEDNGKGMTREEMERALHPQELLHDSNVLHSGLGLSNLHMRIRLVYGKNFGLILQDGQDGGLRVEIRLPDDGGNDHD